MKVDLHISCRKLKNLDVFSKSDPVCRVYEFSEQTKQWIKIGQTERIDNNLNPDFKTIIKANYNFEKHQKIKYEVVDDDGGNSFDMIGTYESSMGDLMGSRAQTLDKDLVQNGKKPGSLGKVIVRAESVQDSNQVAVFKLECQNMPNVNAGCCGLGREVLPVKFEWHKASNANPNAYNKVFESELIRNTQSPNFNMQKRGLTQLCNADDRISFRIYFFAQGQRIGYVQSTMAECKSGSALRFTSTGGQTNAQVRFQSFEVKTQPSFVDYLRSGWQISLTTAIDYTASNRDPKDPLSLHFQNNMNQYEMAINQVGSILEPYDSDK
jgi:hypothetical protein